MKSLVLSSLLAATTLLAMAQPPDLTDTPEKSSVQTDTTYAEGTHTTARERRGLPADSTKQANNSTRKASSVKTKHTHTEVHKTHKRTNASAK